MVLPQLEVGITMQLQLEVIWVLYCWDMSFDDGCSANSLPAEKKVMQSIVTIRAFTIFLSFICDARVGIV